MTSSIENYVPTQDEARVWAARMIASHQYGWDMISECSDPEGYRFLEQAGCDVMAEALRSCDVTLTWPDDTEITIHSDAR